MFNIPNEFPCLSYPFPLAIKNVPTSLPSKILFSISLLLPLTTSVGTPNSPAFFAAITFEANPPVPYLPAVPNVLISRLSISSTNGTSTADLSCLGSPLKSPSVSVSITSREASTRWVTSAARLSLSPNLISSTATVSCQNQRAS